MHVRVSVAGGTVVKAYRSELNRVAIRCDLWRYCAIIDRAHPDLNLKWQTS